MGYVTAIHLYVTDLDYAIDFYTRLLGYGPQAAYDEGDVLPVELHDGSRVLLKKVAKEYDAGNRGAALEYVRARQREGEIVTGLLYLNESSPDLHAVNGTVSVPLSRLPYEELCPGRDALLALQKRFR